MEKLFPCPFCGEQAVRIGPYGGDGLFGVQCLQCNASVRGYDQCQQDAVDAWNTRAIAGSAKAWRNRVAFLKVDGSWRVDDDAIDGLLDEFLAEIERLSRTDLEEQKQSNPDLYHPGSGAPVYGKKEDLIQGTASDASPPRSHPGKENDATPPTRTEVME